MSRTQIGGAAFPLTIDQADITAPDFPRGLDWWQRFMPQWITVTLADDGTVGLDYNGRTPLEAEAPALSAAELRRGRACMVRWLAGSALVRHMAFEVPA
jgi:hypothetical protein